MVHDYRIRVAVERDYPVFAADRERRGEMEIAGIPLAGTLDDLLQQAEIIVDCTPKSVGARNRERYRAAAFARASGGLVALNSVIELMRDLGRSRGDMWEVAVWEDALAVDDREIYLTYQVHTEAIAIPEAVDCIRALTGLVPDGSRSIAKTDKALGITKAFLPSTSGGGLFGSLGRRSGTGSVSGQLNEVD